MSFRSFKLNLESPVLKALIKTEKDELTLMSRFNTTKIKPENEKKKVKKQEKVFGNTKAIRLIQSISKRSKERVNNNAKKSNKIKKPSKMNKILNNKVPHVCSGPLNSGRVNTKLRSLQKLTSAIKLKFNDHNIKKKKVTWVDQVKGSSIAKYSTMIYDHKLRKFREQNENENNDDITTTSTFHCNCRDIRDCPLQGSCLSKNIKFKIKVENNNQIKTFYGTCKNSTFKSRFYQIRHLMKNSNMTYMNPFARYIWKLKRNKENFDVQYRVVGQPEVSQGSSGSKKSCSCRVRFSGKTSKKK